MILRLLPLLLPCLLTGAVLNGVVEDPAGARVGNSRVELFSLGGRLAFATRTDASGSFRFSSAPPASYTLVVSSPAFTESRSKVVLRDSEPTAVLILLALASASTRVTVTAEIGQIASTENVAQRVNVIGQERIVERVRNASVDLFTEEPGVEVQHTAPAMGGVAVRGLLGRNVVLFRDGVRYTTSAQRGGVSTFWNLHAPGNLESAEVLRGPNSAEYGSDSIGGTVHLLSRATPPQSSNGWHGDLSTQYFSPSHTMGADVTATYGASRWGIVASLPFRRNNTLRTGQGIDTHAAVTRFLGLPSTAVSERLPDTAWTQYGGMARVQFALTPTSSLTAHLERGQIDGAKRYDQLLGGDGNLIADLRNLMLDFGYLRYTGKLIATLSFNRQREERVNQGGNGNPAGVITHQYERTTAWGIAAHSGLRRGTHDIVYGVDGYHERERSPAFSVLPATGAVTLTRPRIPDNGRYLLYGAYLQDVWEPLNNGRLRVSGALRFGGASWKSTATPLWPADSLATNALSARVGGVFRIADLVRVHATWSRGFRAPNMTDLGTAGIQGNGFFETSFSDLGASRSATVGDRADDRAVSSGRPVLAVRPEYSDNLEAGAVLRAGRLRTEFTAFRIALRDTIASQTLILPQGAVGQRIGDQLVTRQLASGAVFVPAATNPVLVRANIGAANMWGWEHLGELRLSRSLTAAWNGSWTRAADKVTGLPPDIEGGVPPLTGTVRLRWSPNSRFDAEWYTAAASQQDRLSSLALADRRTGASRSTANIAAFFNNGARARGLVVNGLLVPTDETVAQVQRRVLGSATSLPMFIAIPGYAVHGIRGSWKMTESSTLFLDFSNLLDKSYRSVVAGIDGPGRGVTVNYRFRF